MAVLFLCGCAAFGIPEERNNGWKELMNLRFWETKECCFWRLLVMVFMCSNKISFLQVKSNGINERIHKYN